MLECGHARSTRQVCAPNGLVGTANDNGSHRAGPSGASIQAPRGQPNHKRGLLLHLEGHVLESVPPAVTTWTVPVVAPVGTVVVIRDGETTANVAAVPSNVTPVAPVRSVPRILMAAPTEPEVVCVSTNRPRPMDSLKIVPQP